MSNYNNKNETNVSRSTNVKIGGTTQEIKIGAPEGEDEIARAFAVLLQRINTLPDGSAKNNARIAVNQLQEEAKQGDRADENSIGSLFHFLLETAPDIKDVAIDTFINPIKGLNTVFQKVAERAKAERAKADPR